MPDAHYIAQLKIERVQPSATIPAGDKRQITEVTHLTLRSGSLDSLKERLEAILSIVKDD